MRGRAPHPLKDEILVLYRNGARAVDIVRALNIDRGLVYRVTKDEPKRVRGIAWPSGPLRHGYRIGRKEDIPPAVESIIVRNIKNESIVACLCRLVLKKESQ